MTTESRKAHNKPYLLLSIAGGLLSIAIFVLFLRSRGSLGLEQKIASTKKVNILISVLSDSDTFLFSLYVELYPQEKKAALFFINPLTIFDDDEKTLEELGQDAISVAESNLEDILDHSIQNKIILRETNFKQLINLMGGIEFLFEPKSSRLTEKYQRKQGFYNLDGEDCFDVISFLSDKKILSYIHRLEIQESMMLSIFKEFHFKRDILTKQRINFLHKRIENNLSRKDWESLFDFLKKENITFGVSELPAEPIFRVKKKDEVLRSKGETVKVAFSKFVADVRSMYYSDGERARIEILNGTARNGLARYGKAMLNDKGLKVLTVDNAWETNFSKSVIINRSGNTQYTDIISETFQGRKVFFLLRKDLGLDATVVLGEDFQSSKE